MFAAFLRKVDSLLSEDRKFNTSIVFLSIDEVGTLAIASSARTEIMEAGALPLIVPLGTAC